MSSMTDSTISMDVVTVVLSLGILIHHLLLKVNLISLNRTY